jgi:hypothetical protein
MEKEVATFTKESQIAKIDAMERELKELRKMVENGSDAYWVSWKWNWLMNQAGYGQDQATKQIERDRAQA